MRKVQTLRFFVLSIFACAIFAGCSPEVGSEKWCAQMDETPKGDWTANMATDYAKHCIFKTNNE